MNDQQNTLPLHVELIGQLVNDDAFANYTSDTTNESAVQALTGINPQHLFVNEIVDYDLAKCCLSGLWLLHNCLHQSHEISQVIKTPEGSLWHAMMHRLEGDFWNSKYWYQNAGQHPSFSAIEPRWDPATYVDRCEAAQNGMDSKHSELHQLACAEWRAVFNYCWHNAAGSP